MSWIKKTKDKIYVSKTWLRDIFSYPRKILSESSFDKYWQDPKGKVPEGLNDWQWQRIKFASSLVTGQAVSIADLGCGNGLLLKNIGQNVGASRLIGIDISDFILEKAKEVGVETLKIDLRREEEWEKIPNVDYFLLFELLEHTQDPEAFLKSISSKVNMGIFFSIPNSGFFTYRLRLLFGKFPAQWRVHPGEHIRFWTKRDLVWWLASLGYKNRKIICYKGVPVLNKIWPSLFAAGLFVLLENQ